MNILSKVKRFLMTHDLPMIVMGGGVIQGHTTLTARKFTVDWEALEERFPIIKHVRKYSDKWDYIRAVVQQSNDLELAGWVDSMRTLDPTGHRRVRNRLVTTEFVDFVVDQLITETSEFGDFKFHQCGLGVTAENITDSGIETDTGIAVETGTQVETDHDTYKSVATMTMDATEAIREHVVMSQSGAGTCMDRTLFAAINVVSGNQIEFSFEISFAAGS